MGLFQKSKTEDSNKDELPQYVDSLLENSNQSTNEEIDEKFSVQSMSLNNSYGIDHVVALMRDLPEVNKDVLVTVVTKTLESANINVANIINDAAAKEQLLESEISTLKEDIKTLQEQIAEKEERISVSTAILKETQKVKSLLESTDLPSNNQKAKNKSKDSEDKAVPEQFDSSVQLSAGAQ